MQLRYTFRVYPNGPQCAALARAFGCARSFLTTRCALARTPMNGACPTRRPGTCPSRSSPRRRRPGPV
ncbi:helix-turn-helix domain-containing protein, partial [Streptomyces sp. NPDC059153]|uniref:helix-turn-helix domain-containing protein n=1 Tax=Streptomyces sp. NPDC059153 TaxID=3346743 RepID=UPI0036AA614A